MGEEEERLLAAWTGWCDDLKAAGEQMLAGANVAADKAEGLRWLTRLTRFGLEAGVEFSDPAFPAFYMPTHETVKVMSDNPDAMHWMATIRPDAEYVVRGARGTNPRIMFTTLARTGEGMAQLTAIDTSTIDVDADGRFELHLSRRPHPRNWLELKDGAQSLLVRALFFDRGNEVAPSIRIDEIGGASAPPPLDAATMAQRLTFAKMAGLGSARAIGGYADGLREAGYNRFSERAKGWNAGDPGVHYWHGAWKIAPDEALIVDFAPPDCFFWNFQINNRWAESLDYLHRRVHLNSHGAVRGGDGWVRVIVAHRDPGLPNWLDTEGHGEGTMLVRAIDAVDPGRVEARLVKLESLN